MTSYNSPGSAPRTQAYVGGLINNAMRKPAKKPTPKQPGKRK